MEKPLLSTIIVNYNTKKLLRACLKNLEGSYPNLEIIVIDNGSSDGSGEMLRKEFPQVITLEQDNLGLAAGYNRGLEKARGKYILFLGTDSFPHQNTINGMVDYFEKNQRVGLATCQLVLRDGTLDPDAHRGFPTPWAAFTHFTGLDKAFPRSRVFGQYFLGWYDLSKEHEIDLCISHFMLVREKVF